MIVATLQTWYIHIGDFGVRVRIKSEKGDWEREAKVNKSMYASQIEYFNAIRICLLCIRKMWTMLSMWSINFVVTKTGKRGACLLVSMRACCHTHCCVYVVYMNKRVRVYSKHFIFCGAHTLCVWLNQSYDPTFLAWFRYLWNAYNLNELGSHIMYTHYTLYIEWSMLCSSDGDAI